MRNQFISYLSGFKGKKVLFLTTSNRWDGDVELPKSTQLAYDLSNELAGEGVDVKVMDVAKLKIYSCEGNVSTFKGNTCGLKDAVLKDPIKNPSGCHRCWASINHPDDELWMISKELLDCDAVIFFISVRWGQTNAIYQKLIERLNWIENRHTTLGEDNLLENKYAGCVVIGQNWRGAEVVDVQKQVYSFYGFKAPAELSFNWQYTMDANDESASSYVEAPFAFESYFNVLLRGLRKKVQETMKFLGFSDFINENDFYKKFPHQIKNEKYWRQILSGNQFAIGILDTVMKKQRGFASDRQMEVMRRVETGDKSPYSTKN
jgi:multimeric flavodoxin WrbA